jgi:hypothetical protein
MTVCGAANFHPAKPTAGSSGTPILRRATYLNRRNCQIEIEMQNLKQKPQHGLALIALIRK